MLRGVTMVGPTDAAGEMRDRGKQIIKNDPARVFYK